MFAFWRSVSAHLLLRLRVGIACEDFSSFKICLEVFQKSLELGVSSVSILSSLLK